MKLPLKRIKLVIPVILLFAIILILLFRVYLGLREAADLRGKLMLSAARISDLTQESAVKESTISALSLKIEELQESKIFKELSTIKNVLTKLKALKDKEKQYKGFGVKTDSVVEKMPSLLDLLAEQSFSEALTSIEKLDADLEKLYEEKKEADRKAAEEAQKKYENVITGGGYVRHYVSTEAGTFLADILVADLNKVRVMTDTANDSDCSKDCPLLSLSSFVSRNGGFAGINGTYYCPPEYPQCADKKNSFDFPVYNSRLGKWINKKNLSWDNRALIAFRGSSGMFYKYEKSYSTGTSVDAGLTMVPGLLKDGAVIVGDYSLEAKEKIKSTRSSIGYSGSKVIAVTARGVNNYDMAYVQKALGAKNAVALDGGGSINFYFQGSYYAGPGRAQANSIIFKNR